MDHSPNIELIYSGESDSPSDSKPSTKPDRMVAKTKTAAPRGSLDPELWHEMFGSSDESINSSPGSNRSRSYSYDASVQHEDLRPHADIDDSSRSHRSHNRSNTRYCSDRGASSYVGTTQEEQNRNVLRSATEIKPWMPSVSELRQWYGYIAGSCRIPLFDSSRIHGLDPSARNYRTEHKFYIDAFFRHRWYHGNRKRDEISLVQA